MESSEFVDPGAASAYDGGLLVTNPWVLVTALLLAILIGYLAFWYGRRRGEEARSADRDLAVDRIYDRVKAKVSRAISAKRSDVMTRAEELRTEVNLLLGPLVVFAGPFADAARALTSALGGEADGHGGHGCHGGHGAGHGGVTIGGGGNASNAGHATHVNITIGERGAQTSGENGGGSPSDDGGHGPTDPHGPAPGGGHDGAHGGPGGSSPVSLDAIRAAVVQFNDFWSRDETRGELRNAQRALLKVWPKPPV